MQFICYKKCSTCKKAKNFLDAKGIKYDYREIVEDIPTKEEIIGFMDKFDGPAKKFFNTSGKKYRELGLKDKVKNMSIDEMAEILSSDGMLIKRPILVADNRVLVGFKIDDWEEI